jgi:hypothetical protein
MFLLNPLRLHSSEVLFCCVLYPLKPLAYDTDVDLARLSLVPPDVSAIVLHHNLTAFYIQLLLQRSVLFDQTKEEGTKAHRE